MTIEFKQEQIGSHERVLNRAYIGYFAPNGELIDYNLMFGEEGHDSWRNPVSIVFLKYVSYIVNDTSKDREGLNPSMIENLKYPGIEDDVLIGIGRHRHNYNEIDKEKLINVLNLSANYLKNKDYRDEYDEFTYALLLFFQKAYSNGKFFDTIGKKIYVENEKFIEDDIRKKNKKIQYDDWIYFHYLRNELMQYFKDISVQYLGYDSLERFTTKNKEIKIQNMKGEEYQRYFLANPRVITSSYPNINERYYNYLLMNWRVDRLPRYVFNDKSKCFEVDEFISNYDVEKEEMLGKEIQAIKKLVPLKDRHKYFM